MSEEIKPDPQQAPTQDAQLVAEDILASEEKTLTVDLDADYEASKEFSVSDADKK